MLRQTDWIVAGSLFLFLSSFYFATVSGITSSNDGSHYALIRTLVENRSFALRQFDDYAEGNDIAVTPDGRVLSDRPPGTALLGSAFYAMGGLLPAPLIPLPSRHDAGNPRLLYVLLLPVLAGAGTASALFLLMRRLKVPSADALTAAIFFALGTAHWKYSTVLFSHALSSLLIILSIIWAVCLAGNARAHWSQYGGLGFVLGYSVLVEYSNGLFVLVIGLYLLLTKRFLPRRGGRLALSALAGGGLIAAVFLGVYNTVNFGNPFTLSYEYAFNYPWAGQFGSTFSNPLLPGLQALLIWGEAGGWCGGPCYNQGILLLSPVLLLVVPGLLLYLRHAWPVSLLTISIFLIYLLLFSRHHTLHGFTGDGRYLVPFYGLLVVPLGFCLAWLSGLANRPFWHVLAVFVVYGLFFLSFRNMLLHIGSSYNYDLDLAQLSGFIARPQNWSYLWATVFPNLGNLPLLWFVEGIGLFGLVVGLYARKRQRRRQRLQPDGRDDTL